MLLFSGKANKLISIFCLLSMISFGAGCSNIPATTVEPSSFSIFTAPSSVEPGRFFPERPTEPTGFYPDKDLAEVLADFVSPEYQGTVLVIKGGEIRYEDYSGYASVESEEYCDPDTTYEIGYITRQFTAAGIMVLVEQGLLDLDTTLSEFYPDYEYADLITVRMLLSMTSGIPNYLNGTIAEPDHASLLYKKGLFHTETRAAIDAFSSTDVSFETTYEWIKNQELLFEPGTQFGMSNTGYVILADLIERISEVPYIHFMQKNILTPAGLETASFGPSSETADGYCYQNAVQYRTPETPLIADGGLRMSAKDLIRWMAIIREREILSEESWEILLTPGEYGYGLGFSVYSDGSIFEVGDVGGFSSTAVCVPSEQITAVILSNRYREDRWADQVIESILDYYGYTIGAEPVEPEPQS